MTKTHILPILFLQAALLAPCLALNPIASYRAADLESSSGGMLWRDSAGNHNMQLADPTGVTIGEKPTVGNDTQSAVFDGTQALPFRTATGLPVPMTAVRIGLAFNPSTEPDTALQTLIRHGNWEMRYAPETKLLTFIVWHDAKTYTTINGTVEPGVWQEIDASFEEATLRLEINGVPRSKEAKGALGSHHATSAIFIGASTATRASAIEFRPLRGALAEIEVSGE
jgi:hypothetical protein